MVAERFVANVGDMAIQYQQDSLGWRVLEIRLKCATRTKKKRKGTRSKKQTRACTPSVPLCHQLCFQLKDMSTRSLALSYYLPLLAGPEADDSDLQSLASGSAASSGLDYRSTSREIAGPIAHHSLTCYCSRFFSSFSFLWVLWSSGWDGNGAMHTDVVSLLVLLL